MSISSRFAVGIHILVLIEMNKDGVSSSEFLAESVNTNPVVIRKIMGMLKKSGLVEVHPGKAGAKLAKDLSDITLLDVYKAVNVVQDRRYLASIRILIRNVLWEEIFKIQLNRYLKHPRSQWRKF